MFRTTSGQPYVGIIVFIALSAVAAACGGQAGTGPAQVQQQREKIEQQTKACTAEEFRRLPFGLKWDCPPADFKPAVGTESPIHIAKLMADEDTKDAKRGGTLRRTANASTSVQTLDVFRHTCCSQPWMSLGEMLIHRTAAPEFKLKPYLAESWDISKDGLTYTFNIRKGVKFHDKPPADGRELEAKDVVDTYTYAMGWKVKDATDFFPRRGALANLEKVEAVDKYTVKMTLSKPNSDFIVGVTDGRLGIFPAGLIEFNGGRDMNNFPKTGVSTGPFVMVEYDPKVRAVWKKHPNYWDIAPDGKPYPYVDEIRIEMVGDAATSKAAFIAGQTDLLSAASDQEVDEMQRIRPATKHISFQGGPRYYTLLNYKNLQYNETPGSWVKAEARWALFLANDWCRYSQALAPKTWRYQLFHLYWMPEARSQEELGMMPGLKCGAEAKHQDRLKAVELLKAAGYPKGFKMLDYESAGTATGPGNWSYGEMMHADMNKEMVAKYGLTDWDGKHKPGVLSAETARIEEQQLYDIRTQCSLGEVSSSVVMYQDWYSTGGRNYEGHVNNWNSFWKEMYPDPKDGMDNMTFDKMWERQAAELDPAKRLRLMTQMEHYLIWNMGYVPRPSYFRAYLTQPWVKAYGPNWEMGTDGGVEKAQKWAWLDK